MNSPANTLQMSLPRLTVLCSIFSSYLSTEHETGFNSCSKLHKMQKWNASWLVSFVSQLFAISWSSKSPLVICKSQDSCSVGNAPHLQGLFNPLISYNKWMTLMRFLYMVVLMSWAFAETLSHIYASTEAGSIRWLFHPILCTDLILFGDSFAFRDGRSITDGLKIFTNNRNIQK